MVKLLFSSILSVWGDPLFVREASADQLLYLSKVRALRGAHPLLLITILLYLYRLLSSLHRQPQLLVSLLPAMPQRSPSESITLVAEMAEGLQGYLESGVETTRTMGMATAELISATCVVGDHAQLSFKYPVTTEVLAIREAHEMPLFGPFFGGSCTYEDDGDEDSARIQAEAEPGNMP
jgi:hypothetical protein